MKDTTSAIQNKVDNASSIEELREIIKNLPRDSFCVCIDEMREAHNLKSFNSIQKNVAMSKSHFFDVLSGKAKPQRNHIVKIGMAMHLSVLEINELLKLAHHKELYAKNPEDIVDIYGIQNEMSIIEIEEELMKINASFSLLEK